jgi:hypothetical protein
LKIININYISNHSPNQPINPQITFTQTYSSYNVRLVNLILGVSASFAVVIFDSNNIFVENQSYVMQGEDYTNCDNNDSYVYT